jgi:hypothetical protein
MFYKQGNKYIKQYKNGKIEQIDLDTMTVSTLEVLPDFKKCKFNEYRYAQHTFFNSREFTWEFEGKTFQTIPINRKELFDQNENHAKDYNAKGYPVFYLGKVWYFKFFISDTMDAACHLTYYKKDDTMQSTITHSKNLKSIKNE